ncbi:hypothetical protein F2P56_019057 [Juglans regia]|uniref:Uncharacterized protein At4g38062-like n=2 Tax=Juglans regia TaxID=51240 RepID=A0A2I4G7B8_JUGRE|nr:uncharacterized protein At4g38062-like [Juglans regia]XP_035549485.1 uncharacterized protein At4g38062-like [Juglans regia]KAF5463115.1 hypothetical protein F2P56_019057 [Juglans regia]
MEKVYEELDETKTELEKLRTDYKTKAELCENLKKAHNEQLIKSQEASMKIEKQSQELNLKAEEISVAKQMCEELTQSLNEKESIVKHLTAANDKLRVDCDEKSCKWEKENRDLVFALVEANQKVINQEQNIRAYTEEIEGLKECLSVLQKKYLEAEIRAKASKELRERDDILLNLEEEKRKLEDQIKWKKEQFAHLEEAHEKLRNQFKATKKDWEQERSTLVEEICSLQTSLDCHTRISEDLKNRLQMCNQALNHEQSRRKSLEVHVSELQTQSENAFAGCQDATSLMECLTAQRDEEISALKSSLGTKEKIRKEMEYQAGKLEQENQELRISLRELQEAGIQESGASSSLDKLRNKIKHMEQMHRESSANLSAKEADWRSQLEKMAGDLNDCQSELENKDAAIQELMMELESVHSLAMQLKLQNEEISVMLLVLKLGISEAQLKLANDKAEMDVQDKEKERNVSLLIKQLEMKNAALVGAQADIIEEREKAEYLSRRIESLDILDEERLLMQKELEMKNAALVGAQTDTIEEREKAESLSRRIESLDILDEEQLFMQKELQRYKEMLEESSRCQLHLEDKVLQTKSSLKEKLVQVCYALERANADYVDQICENNEIEFELHIWRSIAERLKVDLEESHAVRKELEASLLSQVDVGETIKQEKIGLIQMLEERDRRIDDLQQRIVLLDQELLNTRKTEAACSSGMKRALSFESEKASLYQTMREKDEILEQLEKEVEWLEKESLRRELESAVLSQIVTERTLEHEKEKLVLLIEDKNQRIDDLMQLMKSSEQKFNSSLISFSSQLAEKQEEINLVHDAWERITAAEILAALEVEEKKLMIVELEDDIRTIEQKLELHEKSVGYSQQQAQEIEAELATKQLEIKNLMIQMETKLRISDAIVNELKSEKRSLHEDVVKLLSDREHLLGFIASLGDGISEFSTADSQLMGVLSRLVQSFDNNNNGSGMVLKEDDELYQSVKENLNIHHSPVTKKYLAISEARSPFRERNN